jgi:capsular polysaccharide transport system permease protein
MSNTEIVELENKFKRFKLSITKKQWNTATALRDKALELIETDTALAYRILQRAHNIAPDGKGIKRILSELAEKLSESNPELMVSTSISDPILMQPYQEKSIFNFSRQLIKFLRKKLNFKILLTALRSKPILVYVLVPFSLIAFYQLLWMSPRYESRSEVIIQQPDNVSTLDPTLAMLSGLGVSTGNSDTKLVQKFINSNDMLNYLEQKMNLKSHYENKNIDFYSRLSDDATDEEYLKYYQQHIGVIVEELSGIISINVQAFEPEFSQKLAEEIVNRAEWFINNISQNLAKKQLKFVEGEYKIAQKNLSDAKAKLLEFQKNYRLLDPEADGIAFQQITYQLEGQLAAKKAELNSMLNSMTESAPQVVALRSQIQALKDQLKIERNRLSKTSIELKSNSLKTDIKSPLSINEIISKFTNLKIALEQALQAYASSKISMEKSRIEAYRQIKYLVVVQKPTKPDDYAYPQITYNLLLTIVLLLIIFGIGRIVIATIEELK